MMWWPFSMTMGWGMIIWTVIFWGGIIALIIWTVKKLTARDSSTKERDPLDITKERYAKGEISKEAFEQIRKDLA